MANLEYWYVVKRYGNDPIEVTEKTANFVKQVIANGNENVVINENMLPTKGLSVEKTTKIIAPDNIYLLAENASMLFVPYGQGEPMAAPDYEDRGVKYHGGILWNWYRKNIDRKEWDAYYAKHPGYYRIDHEDQSIWVACRLVQYKNCEVPIQWILCNETEVKALNGKLS